MDMLERFAAEARRLAREKITILPPPLLSVLGISAAAAVPVLKTLGFKARANDAGVTFELRRRRREGMVSATPQAEVAANDSPFAKLRELIPS
jgi:ATP-dependent RNA helicase SUPV3L1/SUV3